MSVTFDWACPGKLTVNGTTNIKGGVTGTITQNSPNIFIGSNVLPVSVGSNNIGIGDNALENLINGDNNIAVGYNTGKLLINGNNNTMFGQNDVIGNANISLGSLNNTGDNNISIGDNTMTSSSISIGNNIVNAANTIVLGNGVVTNTNGFYVSNIRTGAATKLLYYDNGSGEISCYSSDVISAGYLQATDPTNQLVLGSKLTISAPTATVSNYTIPDLGINNDFLLTTGDQDITGIKTFTNSIILNSNSIVIDGNTIEFESVNNNTFTISKNGNFVLADNNFTITNLIFTDRINISANKFSINNTTIQSSQTAVRTFTLPNIPSSTFALLNLSQNLTDKTFNTIAIASGTSNQITIGNATLNSPNTGIARTYTIPDVGTNASFVLDTGTQNIDGVKTFSGVITPNLIINNTTLNAAGTGPKTFNIPNVTNGEFMLTVGDQDIPGSKNFTNGIVTNGLVVKNTVNTNTVNIINNSSATLTLPNLSGEFLTTSGTQNVTGNLTFTGISTPSITFGSAATTITSSAAVNIDASIPSSDFVMTTGNQTINGVKSFDFGVLITNNNVFYGENAGINTTGINNTAFGYGALQNNITGNDNVAFGYNTGTVTSANNTVTIGREAKATVSETIVFNADSTPLTASTSGMFVKPIRSRAVNNLLTYDTTTNEIGYIPSDLPNLQSGVLNTYYLGKYFTASVTYSPSFTYLPSFTYSLFINNGDLSTISRTQVNNNTNTEAIVIGETISPPAPSIGFSSNFQRISTFCVLADGTPGMIYTNTSNPANIFFVKSSSVSGSSGTWGAAVNTTAIFNYNYNAGSFNRWSMTLIAGRPAFSYIRADGTLGYAIANDTTGSGWTPVTLPASVIAINTVFNTFLIALENGTPAIAFSNGSNLIYYTYALTADGTGSWSAPVTAVAPGSTLVSVDAMTLTADGYPCMAVRYTYPGINYYMAFAYSTQKNGSSGWQPYINIYTQFPYAIGIAGLAIVNGFPAITFCANGNTNNNILYYSSNQINGSSGWSSQTLTTCLGTSLINLTNINGFPLIIYVASTGFLGAIRGLNKAGTRWDIVTTTFDANITGLMYQITVKSLNGIAAITYTNDSATGSTFLNTTLLQFLYNAF